MEVLRLSPQSQHMVEVITLFDGVRRGSGYPWHRAQRQTCLSPDQSCNGYWHGPARVGPD